MLTSCHEYDGEDAKASACEKACDGCSASFGSLDVEVFDIDATPVLDGVTWPIASLPSAIFAQQWSDYKSSNETGCKRGNSVSVHPHGIAEYRSK